MDSRMSLWLLSLPFALFCTGCINTQKNMTTPGSSGITRMDDMPKVVKKDDGPKRNPKPSTEVAIGRMKEMEADTDALKKSPEAQARMRDEARQAYQAALKLDPNNQEATHSLGRLYTKMGDCERAQDIFRKALIKTPRDGTLWYDLGLCYHRKRDFPESARCFTKALELEPENRDYMKKLGFTLAWMGQYDQGLSLLTRTQGAALAHYKVARVMMQKDQTELARRYLQTALRENGQLQEARELLASLENPNANALGRVGFNE